MALPAPSPVDAPRRGLILWAGLAIALTAMNLRTAVTGFTPLLEIIGAQLGYGVAVAGLLGTVPAVSFAVFGFLAPAVTRRFGLERTAAVALGLTATSLILRAYAPGTAVLILATVLALAGIGAANVVIVPLVKAWFPNRLALWTSLYLLLMQAGQFVAPLVAVPLATVGTWRLSVGVWAPPVALAAVVWLVVAIKLPHNQRATVTAPTHTTRIRISRSATVWGLAGLFAATSLANYCIITWLPAVLTDAGGSSGMGGTMVALYSAWGVAAALVVPQLATRLRHPFAVVMVCTALMMTGYLGLIASPLTGTLVWVCALGIGVSTFPLCMTLINLRTQTSQTASTTSGYVQGVGYAIACVGPIGLGLLYEATGSWTTPLVALIAVTVPGAVAGWFACRPRGVEQTAPATPLRDGHSATVTMHEK